MIERRLPAVALALAAFLGSPAAAQDTLRVSVSSQQSQGDQGSGSHGTSSISPDGRFVEFTSYATNLVPGDTNGVTDVFLRDRFTGETTRVSVGIGGVQGDAASYDSYHNSISADGRLVAFSSSATNLVPGDTNGVWDVFVRDVQTGVTRRVSVDSSGLQSDRATRDYTLSQDGRYVLFSTPSNNLVPGDTNAADDIFMHDLVTGQTVRISVDSNGAQSDGDSYLPWISADDRFVVFSSEADNLVPGDTNNAKDVFLRDLATGQTLRVSLGNSGQQGNGESDWPAISADGRFVVFTSAADNLVSGDLYGMSDIFVRDLVAGQTRIVSVDSAGNQGWQGSYLQAAISASGRYVAFSSDSDNLVPGGGAPGYVDEFFHDLRTGQTSLVNVTASGLWGTHGGYSASMSADGRFVSFESRSANLVPNDTNGMKDVYVRDRGSPQAAFFCTGDGHGGQCPCLNVGTLNRGCENEAATGGAWLQYFGRASVAGDTLVLAASGELRGALTVLLQADAQIPPVAFGHGLLCAGGFVERLFQKDASHGGGVGFPGPGDPSISARSAALGGPIAPGSTRYYQSIYRDVNQANCPAPGRAWNVSSGLSVQWAP